MAHVARKRFGQHFLADRGIIERIADAIDLRAGERIVEIGPGLAALTDALLRRVPAIAAVEIDRDLAARLRRRYGERLALVEADDSFTTLSEHDTPAQVVMAKFRAEVAADLAELRLAHIAKARAA